MLPGGTVTFGAPAGSNPPVAINIFPTGSVGGPRTGQPEQDISSYLEALVKASIEDPQLKGLASHLQVTKTPEGMLIELVDDKDNFLFPVGSATIKPEAAALLEKLAPVFARMRNRLEVHGHSDGRKFESATTKKNNWTLSFERANEARRMLEELGVPPGKITGVQARADTQLLNKKDPFAPENRRLGILILKEKVKRPKKPDEDAAPQPDVHGDP
jgi:chemotaxis protein MotB